ncbi:unnamed protein product [Callosobruchus maculatus]|uniref:Uncharacterized protein n=1 Tax=Callosobruchus maculatus TaxID=64391 RepID=A0A653DMM7_CALMS|nr:unnamed protein product [Callosobruchus maculatus]
MDMLPMREYLAPLLDAIRTQNRDKVVEWSTSEQWATIEQLIAASSPPPSTGQRSVGQHAYIPRGRFDRPQVDVPLLHVPEQRRGAELRDVQPAAVQQTALGGAGATPLALQKRRVLVCTRYTGR